MNILNQIIANKKEEVALKKKLISIKQLENSLLFETPTASLVSKLEQSKSGIITEHKRRSPSKSIINQKLKVQEVVSGYQSSGACGMSILTDSTYFGGSLDDLVLARATTKLPLLRKEFIIDSYQLIEAKAYGADVILLIAAALPAKEIKNLSKTAKSLGLEVLLEVHSQTELEKSLLPSVDLLGVNNRNLDTFEVSIDASKKLADKIPTDFIKISESGISNVKTIKELQGYGYQGFLVGEYFMKSNNPTASASQLISQLEA